MTDTPRVMLAEDDEGDVILMRRAFDSAGLTNPVDVVRDGQQALEYLQRERPDTEDRLPALVLLDMKMPRRSGFDVLRAIRAEPLLCTLPVAILTSSSRPEDIERAYGLGTNGYWVKPASLAERVELATFIRGWLDINRPPLVCTMGVRAARAAQKSRADTA